MFQKLIEWFERAIANFLSSIDKTRVQVSQIETRPEPAPTSDAPEAPVVASPTAPPAARAVGRWCAGSSPSAPRWPRSC